jgi:hypothetical protein
MLLLDAQQPLRADGLKIRVEPYASMFPPRHDNSHPKNVELGREVIPFLGTGMRTALIISCALQMVGLYTQALGGTVTFTIHPFTLSDTPGDVWEVRGGILTADPATIVDGTFDWDDTITWSLQLTNPTDGDHEISGGATGALPYSAGYVAYTFPHFTFPELVTSGIIFTPTGGSGKGSGSVHFKTIAGGAGDTYWVSMYDTGTSQKDTQFSVADTIAHIPEPTSISLATISAIVGLGFYRRRRLGERRE